MEEQKYIAPEVEVLEINSEGVLCGSNEGVGENDGLW